MEFKPIEFNEYECIGCRLNFKKEYRAGTRNFKYCSKLCLNRVSKANKKSRNPTGFMSWTKKYRKSVYDRRKKLAMELLGGAKCVNCGCEELSFLEFNHIDGGGCREWNSKTNHTPMSEQLLRHGRSSKGLNVLCRVCNALDFLKRKNTEGATRYKIIFKNKKNV